MVSMWRHAPRGGKAPMSTCGTALQPWAKAARRTWVPATVRLRVGLREALVLRGQDLGSCFH
jgi:hypothetical protein